MITLNKKQLTEEDALNFFYTSFADFFVAAVSVSSVGEYILQNYFKMNSKERNSLLRKYEQNSKKSDALLYKNLQSQLDLEEAQLAQLLELDKLIAVSEAGQESELVAERARLLNSIQDSLKEREASPFLDKFDILDYGSMATRHKLFYGEELVLPPEAEPYLMYLY